MLPVVLVDDLIVSSTATANGDDDALSVGEGIGREISQDGEDSTWEGDDLEFSVPVLTKGPKQSELELRYQYIGMKLESVLM